HRQLDRLERRRAQCADDRDDGQRGRAGRRCYHGDDEEVRDPDHGQPGPSPRIRCTQTLPHTDVMTFARTAIIVPADPANAVAAGTVQKPLLGLTAHASSAPSPLLRRPRVTRDAPRSIHIPAARANGPTSSPAEVRRHAATRDKVADVTRI